MTAAYHGFGYSNKIYYRHNPDLALQWFSAQAADQCRAEESLSVRVSLGQVGVLLKLAAGTVIRRDRRCASVGWPIWFVPEQEPSTGAAPKFARTFFREMATVAVVCRQAVAGAAHAVGIAENPIQPDDLVPALELVQHLSNLKKLRLYVGERIVAQIRVRNARPAEPGNQ
nr:hypothetical protein [Ruegeria arenilitoris]